MKVHVLVEGTSEKEFIDRWAPRAFKDHQFITHPHQGKGTLPRDPSAAPNPKHRGLLDLLPATLRAYAASPEMANDGVLVLVDADSEDCAALKQSLATIVRTISPLHAVVRIAVEEMEAFYLGDLKALKAAYPKANMVTAQGYEPDSIVGTAELFGQIIGDDGLRKVLWAEEMGTRVTITPSRSRSPSFRALHAGINRLVTKKPAPSQQRKKHWKSRHSAIRKKN
jgi:hypothetical protein